jgi:hypothetical protein
MHLKNILPSGMVLQYIIGILITPGRLNCVRLAERLSVSHDALTRVLKMKRVRWQALLTQIILRTLGRLSDGYLCIDDTTINKNYAKVIEALGWLYSHKDNGHVFSYQLVLLSWTNDTITIPLAWRLYVKGSKKTKIQYAQQLLRYAKITLKCKPKYVLMDSYFSSHTLLKQIEQYKWKYITQVKKTRLLNGVQVRKVQHTPCWTRRGTLTHGHDVILTRHHHKYFITNDITLSGKEMRAIYKLRWSIEECFRVLHDQLGIDTCESRSLRAQTTHMHLTIIAYCVGVFAKTQTTSLTHYSLKRRCIVEPEYAKELVDTAWIVDA